MIKHDTLNNNPRSLLLIFGYSKFIQIYSEDYFIQTRYISKTLVYLLVLISYGKTNS